MSCESETVGILRGSGHKMTPQRMMVLTSLRHADNHLSAAEIFQRVKAAYPYVDISTVYRTLTVLKDLRLISETHMGGGDATFEWVASEPHHHLICRGCQHVVELDHAYLTRLGLELRRNLGFEAEIDHFAIFGLCAPCAAARAGATGDAVAPAAANAG
ncbi:MAG: transcriptional repressor [Chloroflexota bacterium]|nr:transcriptional repressor [Chloroflexota bacterium]